ncbi:MAG: molybdenum cofactor biosynthesis protein B [Chromatiales bacterium]|jgi:molybdenum cofactor biosynthesis protein B
MGHAQATEFSPLNIAVLTVSDSRTAANDTSGDALQQRLEEVGHHLVDRTIVPDNIYQMREIFSRWIADSNVHVVISTGGTGLTGRDSTPEAVTPLFDKAIEGFGELFRAVSLKDIGASTIQSRAVAGLANSTLIFCLPGSTGACKTGWDEILKEQLDIRTRPCNFAQMFPRMDEK